MKVNPEVKTKQESEEPTKRDYMILLAIGLLILAGSALMFFFNWNSNTTLGGWGRVGGGLLLFVGGIVTFDGIAQGRSLYLSGTINGVEQTHPFWHKDTEEEIRKWEDNDEG
jgi:hypothetical protein